MSDKTFVYEKFVEGVGVHVDRIGTSVYVHMQRPPVTTWCSRCSRQIETRESQPLVASTAEGRMNLVLFAAEILKAVTAACRHAEEEAAERLRASPCSSLGAIHCAPSERIAGDWPSDSMLAPAVPGDGAVEHWNGKRYWVEAGRSNQVSPEQKYDWNRICKWLNHLNAPGGVVNVRPGDVSRCARLLRSFRERYFFYGERSFELGAEIMNFYWSLP